MQTGRTVTRSQRDAAVHCQGLSDWRPTEMVAEESLVLTADTGRESLISYIIRAMTPLLLENHDKRKVMVAFRRIAKARLRGTTAVAAEGIHD